MRDIDRRLRRYRLSRYAPPDDPLHRRLRWAWLAVALWLVWIGLFSDHSVWRLAGLGRENTRTARELEKARSDAARLEGELRDPRLMRERGEKTLREEAGMAQKDEIIYRIEDGVVDTLAHR